MPTHLFTGLVRLAVRRAWTVILAALLLVIVSGAHAARRFSIDTDPGRLLDVTAPSARGAAVDAAFPQCERGSVAAPPSHHPTG